MNTNTVSRRRFLQKAGALVVSFTMTTTSRHPAVATTDMPPDPKWSAAEQLELTPELDGWLRISEDGDVTLFTGRVEIGNGILTALNQIVADELDVAFKRVSVISADTDVVPNQGITSATTTMGVAAVAIRKAAATARKVLLELAAGTLATDVGRLQIHNGVVSDATGGQVSIGDLIGGRQFERTVDANVPLKAPADYRIVGQSIPRIDIPGKLTGSDGDFVENVRVPGTKYARTLRAPVYGARLLSFDESVAELPGIVAVLPFSFPGDERLERVDRLETMPGDFIAVVADREDQALNAVEELRKTAEWDGGETLPITHQELYEWLLENGEKIELSANGDQSGSEEDPAVTLREYRSRLEQATRTVSATYQGPYLCYGPISPAWSLADVRTDEATVWSATQWPFGARWMVAQALGFETNEQVQVVGGSSSGLYGRRDDYDQEVDVEAALISQEIGAPVRLQWSRSDEFVWGQYRPPQVVALEAGLDAAGMVDGLHARIHTAVRGAHPFNGIAAMALQDTPYQLGPMPIEGFDAGPLLRTGYMRNVFSGYNMFALETFMDELAAAAEEDPMEFRLKHLADERAVDVIRAAAERAGWQPHTGSSGRGMGMSFVLYTNLDGPSSAYMAYVADVDVDAASGDVQVAKMTCAIDAGLVVNPDGVRNQVEGGVIQAMSWAMKEQVTFNREIVTSHDWATYPILTFPDVPDIEVVIIDRPDQPSKGIGEPVTVPVASAIANAIYDATGARVRQLPMTPDRVVGALADG